MRVSECIEGSSVLKGDLSEADKMTLKESERYGVCYRSVR